MNKMILAGTLLCGSALAMTGCQTVEGQMQTGNPLSQPALKSTIHSVDGKKMEVGQIFLRPVDGGVQVYGKLMNLQPGKTVSLHIHETGSCADMGKAAGGHFNTINYVNKKISVADAGKYSVNRLAFIVHGGVDDYTSQPAGNAGDRVACGIIEKN